MADSSDVSEVQQYVAAIEANSRFPIPTVEQLIAALGGPETQLSSGATTIKARQLAGYIPSYYFPMVSSRDLADKLHDLQRRHQHGAAPPAEPQPTPEDQLSEEFKQFLAEFRRNGHKLEDIGPPVPASAPHVGVGLIPMTQRANRDTTAEGSRR
jgi:hypothetical protein